MTQNTPEPTPSDTRIDEPPPAAGEVETLMFALERSRAQFAWKTGGLDEAALRRRHPPSVMTLGGLVKHLALVEDSRTALWLRGEAPAWAPWSPEDDQDPDRVWRSAAKDSAADLYAIWHSAVERSRAAVADALATGGADQLIRHA